jgi:hypothetical protein
MREKENSLIRTAQRKQKELNEVLVSAQVLEIIEVPIFRQKACPT